MHSVHCSMTANDIYRFAATMLEPNMKWHDYGPKGTVSALLEVLFLCYRSVVFGLCGLLAIERCPERSGGARCAGRLVS